MILFLHRSWRQLWLVSFLSVLLASQGLQAQEKDPKAEGSDGFEIVSEPPGATVHFSGEYDLVATTPFLVRHKLLGPYSVTASKPGYETYSRKVSFPGSHNGRLTIRMKSKTPLKAALRSLVLPGWGQFYSGEKTRGVMMSTVGFGAGLTAIIAELRYQDRYDEYEKVLSGYQNARSIEEKTRLRNLLEDKHDRAYDAETLKRNLLVVTALVWAYNVVDACLFFPDQEVDLEIGERFSLREGELSLRLCKRF